MQCVDLPLNPSPSPEWDVEWAQLMTNPWLAKKTNREQRLREHWRYVQEWLPEIEQGGSLLDIGPGLGELLEIAEHFGGTAVGWDESPSSFDESYQMGRNYARASDLMFQRQCLTVHRGVTVRKFQTAAVDDVPLNWHTIINSRGSLEQVMAHAMDGEPHWKHHDCKRLRWNMERAAPIIDSFFVGCRNMLRLGGVLMIHANGCATDGPGNVHDYDAAVMLSAAKAGLELVKRVPPVIHKWRKP